MSIRALAAAFVLGDVALLVLPALPDRGTTLALLAGAAALAAWRPARLSAVALIAFALAVLRAHGVLAPALPGALEGEPVVVTGVVQGLVEARPARQRFVLAVETLHGLKRAWSFQARVRLDWYAAPVVPRPGERWRLAVRLERPHGLANPGGFDYEAWLFRQRIRATGYVLASGRTARLDAHAGQALHRLRAALAERLETAVADRDAGALVKALALGIRDGLGEHQWEVLRRTGTGHLIAISGLHVGLVGAMAFALAWRLWTWVPGAALAWPAPRAAALAALAAAGAYAALAGFSVPTQRALAMLAAALLDRLLDRPVPAGDRLALAVLAVLLIDPFAVLHGGLWLSFTAVAAILWVMGGRLRPAGRLAALARVNVVVVLALTPWLLLFFGAGSLVAPLANVLAVPCVALVVVPAVLLGVLGAAVGVAVAAVPLALAAGVLAWLQRLLAALAALPFALVELAPGATWTLPVAFAGIALVLAPRGVPARWVGVLWLAPLLLHAPPRPAPGAFTATVLDVGQGLAVVIATRAHVLLYDAGPRFGPGFDAGRAAVLPYLRHRRHAALDAVVLSHGDSDHTGGWPSVRARIRAARVLASEPGRLAGAGMTPCRAGQRWHWDGVTFEILYPRGRGAPAGNDGSCVLRVAGRHGTLLLPGDLEGRGERRLLRGASASLAADVLVAPHHGSRTSSSAALVEAVRPRLVIVSAGYRNRFGFPHPEVPARYRAAGARVLETASQGAIRVSFASGGPRASGWRARERHFWHARPAHR